MHSPVLTHAGGVVRTRIEGDWRFLLVRASKPPYDWVLPKGHIEAGETPEQTAEREIREEAGVVAEVTGVIGDVAFTYRNVEVRVRYFLMNALGTVAPLENRETCWRSLTDAEGLLVYENAREVLRRAAHQHP